MVLKFAIGHQNPALKNHTLAPQIKTWKYICHSACIVSAALVSLLHIFLGAGHFSVLSGCERLWDCQSMGRNKSHSVSRVDSLVPLSSCDAIQSLCLVKESKGVHPAFSAHVQSGSSAVYVYCSASTCEPIAGLGQVPQRTGVHCMGQYCL